VVNHGTCMPPDESRKQFAAWYFNDDPTLGPVGFALSTRSCRVRVQHLTF